MRFDARILLGLLGCWINLSTADDTSSNDGSTGTLSSPSPVVSLANALETPPTFFATQDMTFFFETTNAAVTTINLKLFDPATPEGDSTIGTGMVGLAVAPGGSSTGTGGTGGPVKAADAGVARLQSRAPLSLEVTAKSVEIPWSSMSQEMAIYSKKPMYLQFLWSNSSVQGSTASPLFAFYANAGEQEAAAEALDATQQSPSEPAREQTSIPLQSPGFSTSSTQTTATETTATPTPTMAAPAPNSNGSGLNKSGIIGVAVGAGGAGLLIAGVLVWLFCFKRRRNNSATMRHHATDSEVYGTDSGRHGMMMDKELPHVTDSAPHSVHDGRHSLVAGAGGHDGPYAPYSDRPITPPENALRHATPGASQTDLTSTRGTPTPTPAINTRYAHLVEEGMTEDEIRQLEEEERHLDAAIEHAGQRGAS